MQDAGAAAVECNFYNVPQRMQGPGRDVEARCMEVVHALKQELDVPVAVKLTPYFSSFGHLALRLVETGADGLVLFNRFLQPRVDVQTLTVAPVIGLSRSSEARLPQTWIALLREPVDLRAARVAEPEQPRALVERLAGRVVERGTHEQLRSASGLYSRMLRTQQELLVEPRAS
jgi:dihydroorotate dehydrogenase (fumarate)